MTFVQRRKERATWVLYDKYYIEKNNKIRCEQRSLQTVELLEAKEAWQANRIWQDRIECQMGGGHFVLFSLP